jgi:ABC-type transport system involved in cytochrome c biogenesis ATPase subunit
MTFFLVVGALVGTLEDKGDCYQWIWLFAVFFAGVFFLPWVLDKFIFLGEGLGAKFFPTTLYKACVFELGTDGSLGFSIFGVGLMIHVCILCGLLKWVDYNFRRSLYRTSGKDLNTCGELKMELKKGTFYVWRVQGESLKNLLYKLMSGQNKKLKENGFPGKVCVEGVDIVQERNEKSFLYLCHPGEVPGEIQVRDFFHFFGSLAKVPVKQIKSLVETQLPEKVRNKRFSQLSAIQKCDTLMMLTYIYKGDMFLVNEMATNMPAAFAIRFKDRFEALRKQGACVLYLTSNEYYIPQKIPWDMNYFFENTTIWSDLVECHRNMLKKKVV